MRHLPPTAVPVRASDVWRGIAALFDPAAALSRFRSLLLERTGSADCYLLSSGRAALTLILLGLKRLSDRTRVIVPAYSCPTVVQSVLAAGLEPALCDVSPTTLDLDREALNRLIAHDVLAVVPVHLYGLAHDVRDVLALARQHDIFVVEDAAQAFGATLCGRLVGTWGDAGLYSLGQGKCLPAGHGGVIVAQERCAPAIAEAVRSSIPAKVRREVSALALFLGYGLATHPSGWWFVVRSPLNPAEAGMNGHALPSIALRGLSATHAGIGASILARLEQVDAMRRRNARRLIDPLAAFDWVRIPPVPAEAEPVFLRLPLVVDGAARAEKLFQALARRGIGVSRSYTHTLPDLFAGELRADPADFPGAAQLATCLLTLPTHPYLQEEDFARVVQAFETIDAWS
jgi:perosamine synthetase